MRWNDMCNSITLSKRVLIVFFFHIQKMPNHWNKRPLASDRKNIKYIHLSETHPVTDTRTPGYIWVIKNSTRSRSNESEVVVCYIFRAGCMYYLTNSVWTYISEGRVHPDEIWIEFFYFSLECKASPERKWSHEHERNTYEWVHWPIITIYLYLFPDISER